jgi:YcaO-like protein with predicted kinase domain
MLPDHNVVKGFQSGTHRQVSPRDTLARVAPHLAAMGITRLANVTGLDTIGIPVVMACRPNSRSLAVTQGKGLDLDSAKASAVMESVESYHAERIRLPLKFGSHSELRDSHSVVDVDKLPREGIGDFNPHVSMLWIEGEDWLQSDRVWIPFQMVHTAYTTRMRFDLTGFTQSSNGLASGNHVIEAASHAICEVIERDAYARHIESSEEEREAHRIDLATVDHPDCRDLLDRFDRAGVAVAVWDMTSDLGIAAFGCLIADRAENPMRRLYAAEGSGVHPVRHVAMVRALTEAAQSRLTAISGARDDMPRENYDHWREPTNLLSRMQRARVSGRRSYSAVPSFEADTFEDDVAHQLDRIRRCGYERVVIVDLTLPEFGLPVVRVLIPGMRILLSGPRAPIQAEQVS